MAAAASPQTGTSGPVAVGEQTTLGISGTIPGLINLGTTDPSAGGGVPAPIGSLGMRATGGVGSLWVKTGAADTAWTENATP